MKRLTTSSVLILALLAIVWGTQYFVIRAAQSDLPAWLAVALRFAIVAVLAQSVMTKWRGRGLKSEAPQAKARWCERILLGFTHALAMGLIYIAERSESSAIAICVMASTPLFVSLFSAHLVAGEPLTARAVGASLLGLLGVALLSAGRLNAPPQHALGLLLLIIAAISSAVSKTVGKRLAQLPALTLLRDLGFVVALSSTALWLVFEREHPIRFTIQNTMAIVYLGVVASAAASGAWFVLLRRLPVTKLSHLQFATAIIGVASGVIVGEEKLHLHEVAGIATILAAAMMLVGVGARARQTIQSE